MAGERGKGAGRGKPVQIVFVQFGASREIRHALSIMEDSELVAETLGEQVFNYVLLNKRQEWKAYRAQVTPFELSSNLEIL